MKALKQFLFVASMALVTFGAKATTTTENFNRGWQFSLSDSGAYSLSNYNYDSSWREVVLPHDWSVELSFTNDLTKADGATGYLPGGVAWYSKDFEKSVSDDQKCYIIFDGVYNNSEYWINGKKLGEHPYGYSPFYFDVTEYLRPEGQTNRLMVRVDRSHFADSRWYTGSGIYRDVTMLTTDKLHIPVWGTYITTPAISKQSATVSIETKIENNYTELKSASLKIDIVAPNGEVVATKRASFDIKAGEQKSIEQSIEISAPEMWGIETPNLYTAKSSVVFNDEVVSYNDEVFGFRTIEFDAQKGFFLNGENMKIKGVCLHHDGGLVGAAVPRDVWARRLQTLKDGGCNAIRSSHNPCSDEFLELCDQMGFLVQQEFFDEWDNPKDKRQNMNEQSVDYATRGYDRYFQEWGERDLKNTMLRDRNHPCIFQWSIGNEIEWTYEGNKESTGFFGADANGNYFWNQPPYGPERIREELAKQPKHTYDVGRTARKLAAWTREMDSTRPVVANCILPSVSFETGYIDALDVAGFSYRRVMYDYAHKHYPNKPVMGTENLGQWHEWKAVLERPFVPGMFIWTGVDYMGERGGVHSAWPEKATVSGLLDLAGFEKPSYAMMKSLWIDEPYIAIYSQLADKSSYKQTESGDFVYANKNKSWENRLWVWDAVNAHWNYAKGDKVIVEIYSNCEQVELFQNGRSKGVKYLKDFEDHIYKWSVDFKDGNITAKGIKGRERATEKIETAGEAVAVELTVDKGELRAKSTDVAHVVVQLVDKKGRAVKCGERKVEFKVDGSCRVLGVDNGATGNVNPFQSSSVETAQGRCLMILQAGDTVGDIAVTATVDGLKMDNAIINIK